MHLLLHTVIKGGARKFCLTEKIALWCERMGMNTVFQILNVVSPELSS